MPKTTTKGPKKLKIPPAFTSEEKENRLIALAWDVAETKLRDGTASNQLVCQLIKAGSSKERLEKDILKQEKELKQAKTEAIKSAKRVEELYANALRAMQTYSGQRSQDEDIYRPN